MNPDSPDRERQKIRVILAQPRGFCAGVDRAIAIAEGALKLYEPPVYVRHEIVHNRRVVENLKAKGVRFVEEIHQIPDNAIAVFSAHGVSKKVQQDASERGLESLDATCPLVSKVHKEGQRYAAKGYDVILIGHENHPEVEGTLGQIPGPVHLVSDAQDVEMLEVGDPDKVAYVTQTTLSVDDTRDIIKALKQKFPNIAGPNTKDICYATQNRQAAVRALAAQVDLMLVVGAHNSSNSNRLCEVSNDSGTPSHLVEDPAKIDPLLLQGVEAVGITAGASTPEELVQELIGKLREFADLEISNMDGIVENVRFGLPPSLRSVIEAG
ncbi:MAG: 4-hydroxy-3-methylbut-2-enyl diphosphate reductase [Gammaproteobacteria bacterium]|nr:4-hydroxy-3-methylbut-2-enyl diphosphate reductase [Gammaproteobacteria bacterium]